eukprot:TRINITY_DN2884_c0_g1_i1.p1 TRINITY_DN2884_c0_g1~~TRINITY_DN2884_c0_g1_i1.p1  ORF type:complete len:374 (+),score=92.33 TRINITY_DN2884_c0_g1_i1:113-1234(+)
MHLIQIKSSQHKNSNMRQERRCGEEYKESLKHEIRELLKHFRGQARQTSCSDSHSEVSLDSSLDSYPRAEEEVAREGNCYVRKVDSLRERLGVMKSSVRSVSKDVKQRSKKGNGFYSRLYAEYKGRLDAEESERVRLERRKAFTQERSHVSLNEPREITIFNSNIFFKGKYEELKPDVVKDISVGFSKRKDQSVQVKESPQNIKGILEENEVLSNKLLNSNAETSNRNCVDIIDNSANGVKESGSANNKENKKPATVLGEAEIAKLNTIKQNVEEIKNRLNEYSKDKLQSDEFHNQQTMKPIKKKHKNFDIHPKENKAPVHSDCTKELKKWSKKKVHRIKRGRCYKYCGVCIELLHRGYSSKDCPTHTQMQLP